VTEIPFNSLMEWIDRMRRFDAPMIFTLEDWGLADARLPERRFGRRIDGEVSESAAQPALFRNGLYLVAVLLLPLLVLWHRDNVLYSPPLCTDPRSIWVF